MPLPEAGGRKGHIPGIYPESASLQNPAWSEAEGFHHLIFGRTKQTLTNYTSGKFRAKPDGAWIPWLRSAWMVQIWWLHCWKIQITQHRGLFVSSARNYEQEESRSSNFTLVTATWECSWEKSGSLRLLRGQRKWKQMEK